ncbi:MAG: hypothetical protein JXA67_08405, partial [Micromonosporaceae bacterium]|nr:hypothetical protein [Micromonosporaceae bacterium]
MTPAPAPAPAPAEALRTGALPTEALPMEALPIEALPAEALAEPAGVVVGAVAHGLGAGPCWWSGMGGWVMVSLRGRTAGHGPAHSNMINEGV